MAMPRSPGSAVLTSRPLIRIWPEEIGLQSGDRLQQRGLAAAGRADHDDELALLDGKIDAAQRMIGAVVLVDCRSSRLVMHPGSADEDWHVGRRSVGEVVIPSPPPWSGRR